MSLHLPVVLGLQLCVDCFHGEVYNSKWIAPVCLHLKSITWKLRAFWACQRTRRRRQYFSTNWWDLTCTNFLFSPPMVWHYTQCTPHVTGLGPQFSKGGQTIMSAEHEPITRVWGWPPRGRIPWWESGGFIPESESLLSILIQKSGYGPP